jgi:ankyrin repeat protein
MDGLLPLHFAAQYGSLEILQFLICKYPEAAAASAPEDSGLPLHCFLRGEDPSWCIEMLRELLRCYPMAAGKENSKGITPYQIAVKEGMSTLIRRLLLRADPTIDPAELRRLNYEERRMAMFLVFSAIPKDITDSFVVRLRRLKNKDQSLLRLIVAFL